jgi:hypothetical protein
MAADIWPSPYTVRRRGVLRRGAEDPPFTGRPRPIEPSNQPDSDPSTSARQLPSLRVETPVLRTLALAIALIVGGLPPAGMACDRPNAPVGSASSACRHAAHHHTARFVVGDACSLSSQPILIVREEVRRTVSQPSLAALTAAFAIDMPVGDSTLPATSPAARQHHGWRGSPLVLRI